MRLTFVLSLAAVTMLYLTLRRLELTAKHAAFELRALRRRTEAHDRSDVGPNIGYGIEPAASRGLDEAAFSTR
jgi:hypothetical protein